MSNRLVLRPEPIDVHDPTLVPAVLPEGWDEPYFVPEEPVQIGLGELMLTVGKIALGAGFVVGFMLLN